MDPLERLRRRVRPWHVAVGLLVLVVGSVAWFSVGPMERLGSDGILDDDWGFTPADVQAHFDRFGDDGVADYRQFLWLDLLYPLLYVPGLTAALLLGTRRFRRLPDASVWLAPAAGLLDWLENLLLLRVVDAYPGAPEAWLVHTASAVNIVKLLVVTATFALVAALLLVWLLKGLWNPVRRGPAAKRARTDRRRRGR